MDDDWGLQAVVRGCSAAFSGTTSSAATSASTTTTTTATNPFMADFQLFNSTNNISNNNNSFLFSPSFGNICSQSGSSGSGSGQLFSLSASDPIIMRPTRNHVNIVEDLHELYKPFFPKSETSTNISQTTNPNSIIISSFSNTSSKDQRSVQQLRHNNIHSSPTARQSQGGSASSATPRSKKRKNQLKKVCQVPAESLSSDIWAWRKYGQKPIKGSPYPRGYYRCSSSKGCLARKQVERNRSDPAMFIVTYTAEHNHPAPTHRNSLAGSTRQKPSLSTAVSVDPTTAAAKSSETAKTSSSATSPEEEDLAAAAQAQSGSATESKEGPESSTLLMDDDEDDEEFGFSDMAVSDDFFVGLEGLGAPAAGDFFSDNFPTGFGLPWSASSAATAAGSI